MSDLVPNNQTNVMTQVEAGAKALGILGAIRKAKEEAHVVAQQAQAAAEEVVGAKKRAARDKVQELVESLLIVWDAIPAPQKEVPIGRGLSRGARILRAAMGRPVERVQGRVLYISSELRYHRALGLFLDGDGKFWAIDHAQVAQGNLRDMTHSTYEYQLNSVDFSVREWTALDDEKIDWEAVRTALSGYLIRLEGVLKSQEGWALGKLHRERWKLVCSRYELRKAKIEVEPDVELDRADTLWLLVDDRGTRYWHTRNVQWDHDNPLFSDVDEEGRWKRSPWEEREKGHRPIDAKLHREDGPAVEYPHAKKHEWWLDGESMGSDSSPDLGKNPFLDALWGQVPITKDIILASSGAYKKGKPEPDVDRWLKIVETFFDDPAHVIGLMEKFGPFDKNLWEMFSLWRKKTRSLRWGL